MAGLCIVYTTNYHFCLYMTGLMWQLPPPVQAVEDVMETAEEEDEEAEYDSAGSGGTRAPVVSLSTQT